MWNNILKGKKMILSKLPKEIRLKIEKNIEKINTFNSSELLNYSKALRQQKSDVGINIYNYLLKAIDARRDTINNASDVKSKCKDADMVKKFLKERR